MIRTLDSTPNHRDATPRGLVGWGLATILVPAGVLLLFAAPVRGQEYGNSAGWSIGTRVGTSLNDGADADAVLKPGVSASLAFHVDHWWRGGRTGLRFQLDAAQPEIDWQQGPREIAVYTGDLNLTLRLMPPSPAQRVAPYVSVGVGGIWWLLGKGPGTTFSEAGAFYDGDEGFDLIGVGSIGLDFITPVRFGDGPLVLRVEARDGIQFNSPFQPLDVNDSDFGMVHNLRFGLGLHTGFGRLRN